MNGAGVAADKPDDPDGAHAATAPAALLLAEIERLKAELIKAEWQIAELEARADIDPLLDILNRRGFDRELKRALAYVKRYATPAVLVFIDLDDFKIVNDRHGHAAGDALLKAVVAGLKSHVRASDTVARLGGDEFAVLMWNLETAQASAKALELEIIVAGTAVMYGPARLTVGASAGYVPLDGDANPAAILEAADQAMYARKKAKRG
ncbi:MAG: GGDEF domain-containing protein [Rhizobiales bacterium]|nr:GGDEF domain-containing protein [Hyphomicrobiales bacterium]